jgi:hypothetical protein
MAPTSVLQLCSGSLCSRRATSRPNHQSLHRASLKQAHDPAVPDGYELPALKDNNQYE